MTEEEKKGYEELKSSLYRGTITQFGKRMIIDIIEKQQAEIEKKDKIIDKMATECSIQTGRWENLSNEDIIEYFTNKEKEER